MFFYSNKGFGQTVETFTTIGGGTWVCPSGVTTVDVECWGAGGGGGNSANTNANGGSGGGGGAYSKSTLTVTPGVTYYFFVGSGGSGGPANSTTAPNPGEDSWFNTINSAPVSTAGVLADGGYAGVNNSTATPTNKGLASSSLGLTIITDGSNGIAGAANGGGDGGNGANGGAGGAGSSNGDGSVGTAPGGGGGGGNDAAANIGGNGGSGQVKLTYTAACTPQTITFGALAAKTVGDAPFALTGSASTTVTYVSSNTAVATVSGSTVTIVGAGSTNITASAAADATYCAATDVVQSLTVNAGSSNCGSETFTNSALTASYANGSYTGDNGVTWSYVSSRNEDVYGITGKGIMLRNLATLSTVTSSAVSGGIGTFTCSLKKAFTGVGNRQVELFINGVSKGTSIAWDNTTVQTFTISNINITGNIIVEIRNITANQVIVDDITWTCYSSTSPNLTVSALTGFGNVCTNTTAGPNSFTITGTNLTTADVTVGPLTGFTFCTTSGGTYTNSLTLTQSGGAYSQTIYVKFNPTLVQSYNGNIPVGGGGATSVNRSVIGSGICTSPAISTPTSASITTTTAVLGGNITATGCTNVTERGIYWSTTNGFADGAGTKVSETPGPYSTGTFTVNVSGLSASTTYYYKAFALNSCGTVYTIQGTYTTPCANVSLPYTQGFNAATIPSCWLTQTVVGSSAIQYVASSSNPTTVPQEGTHYVYWNSYSITSGNETRLISPAITTTGTASVDVKFYWKNENNTTYTDPAEGVLVQYSTDGSTWDAGTFYSRHDGALGAGTSQWNLKTLTLPAGAGNQATIYVSFKFHSLFDDNCSMDNVVIEATPSCLPPSALTSSDVTTTTATVSWNAASPAPANGYQYEIRTSGAAGSGATGLVVSGTTVAGDLNDNVTGLTANTTYYLYVRSDCGGSNYSSWSSSYSFTTLKIEPTNQVSAFACGSTTSNTIPLTWTAAAAGSQAPDGYLILWSTGAITPPVDGTAQVDGVGVKNITYGTNNYTATGLNPSTTYNFQLWTYTNSGTGINYNLAGAPTTSCATISGSASLWFQGFEGTAADTWVISSSSGGTISTSTGSADFPANQRLRTNTHSWQTNNPSTPSFGTLELQSSSVAGYTNLKVVVYLSSTSVTSGNGADASDFVRLFVALDGGAFAANTESTADICVKGNSNSRWSFNNTENATTTAGTNLVVTGSAGTNSGTIYSKLIINIPDGTTSVALRIVSDNDDVNEIWNIDDVEIIGTIAGPTILTGSVTSFGDVCTGSTSAEKTFNVSGFSLTNNIVITPPTGYEISTGTGGSFVATNPITLIQSGGTVNSTPIYVRFVPSLVQAYNGDITLTSTGATTKNVALTGNGVNNTAPSITSPTSTNLAATSVTLGGNVTSIGCSNVTERGIYWSTSNGFADGTGTKVSELSGPYSVGVFTLNVSGLTSNTIYYYKAFATNSSGTVYTTQGTFTTLCSNSTIPYFQGFNSTTIPSCWSSVVVADPGTDPVISYQASNTYPPITSPREGTQFVKFNSYDCSNNAEMRLVSPPLTTTGISSINMDFLWYESSNYSTYLTEGMTVQYSTNGGTTWSNVQFYQRYNSVVGWKIKNCVFPAAIDNQPNVLVGFLFHSQFGYDCIMDSVKIYTCSAPTVNSANMSFSNITSSSLDLTIGTSGNGAKRIIVACEGVPVSFTPANNTSYDAVSVFSDATDLGSGNKVVYHGTGTTVSISGLNGNTTYYFKVFEYNCNPGNENYYTAGVELEGNTTTLLSPVTNLHVDCQTSTTAEIAWTPPVGDYTGVIIGVRNDANNPPHTISNNASLYNANAQFSLGTQYGGTTPYSFIVYKGTGTSVTVTGLTAGQPYKFMAYTYKNETSTIWAASQPIVTIPSLGVANVSGNFVLTDNAKLHLQWTNPGTACFDEVMIIANVGSAITTQPTGDGSSYTANLVFGSGSAYGTGYVVYKGGLSPQTVTGLANGTQYCFTWFVRKGTNWSTGVSGCGTPASVTTLLPGDLAIVAVNTQATSFGSADEICFFAFQDITEGTSIDFTDNGFERLYAGKWASSEGTIRITRKTGAGTVSAGTTICFQGKGYLQTDFNIFVCGIPDDANWTFTSLNNAGSSSGSYDLNVDDQIWIIQGGAWDNTGSLSAHNATYSGNVLYGWTATGWETAPGYDDTKGSTLYEGTDCFNTNVQVTANHSKVKYTGSMVACSQFDWLLRINDNTNWTGYATNAEYYAARDYVGTCFTFTSTAAISSTGGVWTGEKSTDWFYCGNWENLRVPNGVTNVSATGTVGNNIIIDDGIVSIPEAECNNLLLNATVSGSPITLTLNNLNSVLNVYGNFDNRKNVEFTNGKINFKGNFINSGTFTHSAGTAYFNGSGTQSLTGATTFYNVTMNNSSSGLSLQNDMTVNNILTLLNGTINSSSTPNGLLKMTAGSSVSGGSNVSYINGPIQKIGNTAFVFPVGKNGVWARIGINASSNVTNAFTAEYFRAGAPNNTIASMNSGLDHVSYVEYWVLEKNVGSDYPGVTLYWENAANSGIEFQSPYNTAPNDTLADLRVAHWNGTKWDDMSGGTSNAGGTWPSGTISSTVDFTSYSPITFGSKTGKNPLPVELVSFSAKKNKNEIDLYWLTQAEFNNDYFIIERSSDAYTFYEIGKIKGMGTVNTPTNYVYTDESPLKTINYYRLKQTDFDGKFTYSNIVSVLDDGVTSLSVSNLFILNNTLSFLVTSSKLEKFNLKITDALGRTIYRKDFVANEGDTQIYHSGVTISPGIYYLMIFNNNLQVSIKFIMK